MSFTTTERSILRYSLVALIARPSLICSKWDSNTYSCQDISQGCINESRKLIPLLEVCVFFYTGIETWNVVSVYVYHDKGFTSIIINKPLFVSVVMRVAHLVHIYHSSLFPASYVNHGIATVMRKRVTFFFMFTFVSKLSPSL